MRLPRAIYLLPPQGKSFLICPKHFSFVTSAASLTLWNVCGLQVDWSVECKVDAVCVACVYPNHIAKPQQVCRIWPEPKTCDSSTLAGFPPFSLSLCTLPTLSCISATAITIKHHRHFCTTFRLRLFAVFHQAFPLFSLSLSLAFYVSREGNCAAVVACSLCLSFVYCLMPLMSCQSQGYSINWLSPSLPPSGIVTGDLLQPLALKSNFISRQKFWLLVLLCSSLIPISFSSLSCCSFSLSSSFLFAAIDNCATGSVDIPGKSTTATTTGPTGH